MELYFFFCQCFIWRFYLLQDFSRFSQGFNKVFVLLKSFIWTLKTVKKLLIKLEPPKKPWATKFQLITTKLIFQNMFPVLLLRNTFTGHVNWQCEKCLPNGFPRFCCINNQQLLFTYELTQQMGIFRHNFCLMKNFCETTCGCGILW